MQSNIFLKINIHETKVILTKSSFEGSLTQYNALWLGNMSQGNMSLGNMSQGYMSQGNI